MSSGFCSNSQPRLASILNWFLALRLRVLFPKGGKICHSLCSVHILPGDKVLLPKGLGNCHSYGQKWWTMFISTAQALWNTCTAFFSFSYFELVWFFPSAVTDSGEGFMSMEVSLLRCFTMLMWLKHQSHIHRHLKSVSKVSWWFSPKNYKQMFTLLCKPVSISLSTTVLNWICTSICSSGDSFSLLCRLGRDLLHACFAYSLLSQEITAAYCRRMIPSRRWSSQK